MTDLFRYVLDRAAVGIIIIDADQRVVFWNKYVEQISGASSQEVLRKKLSDVCVAFALPRYQQMLDQVISHHQCRFCASRIHRAFLYHKNRYDDAVRQNLTLEPFFVDGREFVLIQIIDITNQVKSERDLTTLIAEMQKDYEEVKESEEINRRLAVTDSLTGLPNRIALLKKLTALLDDGEQRRNYALMFLDLDGFKNVNDTYGHTVGDQLLIATGKKLRAAVRGDDMVARIGGDEFVLLIKCTTGQTGAATVAAKLVGEISKPVKIDGCMIRITCSIGVALLKEGGINPEEMLRHADQAMYFSKNNGKDTFTFYDASESSL